MKVERVTLTRIEADIAEAFANWAVYIRRLPTELYDKDAMAKRHRAAESRVTAFLCGVINPLSQPDADALVAELNKRLAAMSPTQRCTLFGDMAAGYCQDCGWPKTGRRCSCTNDD